MDTLPKKAYRQTRGTWKDVQHHKSSGKGKSKPQWDNTSYQSEWLLSKREQITSAGEDVKKREPLCTVRGHV